MNIEDVVRRQVQDAVGVPALSAPVRRLRGDASARAYYRVETKPHSYIVMVMPQDAKRSEEGGASSVPAELPFTSVHRYLTSAGTRVPAIYRHDDAANMMVLEDLGDVTLEQALKEGHSRSSLYFQAIDALARLRVFAEKNPDLSNIAFQRSFDEALYMWELQHFREWGLEAWSEQKLTGALRQDLDSVFARICGELAGLPRGFTHRDYQSRNIMVKSDELVVIDFQDALLGPRQYDLVALLRDSYVELPREFVDECLERYAATIEQLTTERIDRAQFLHVFELLTVQRKLKDAARFEYINRVKLNRSFLPAIPLSLKYVRDALDRLDELSDLRRLVAPWVPALA